MSDTTYFHLFEVEYISCEGNFRTANVVIQSTEAEVSVDSATSAYYSNSDWFGDSPSTMVGGYHITTLNDDMEMSRYCSSQSIYAETISV
jgi:hypothetical protein